MNVHMNNVQLIGDNLIKDSGEYSPSKTKRMRLDDGCNNNLETTKNDGWTCPVDTSLVEADVMVDLGVSMLADETSCESIKKIETQSQFNTSSTNKQSPNDDDDDSNKNERSFCRSNSDSANLDRLVEEDNNTNMENPASVLNTMGNETGYSFGIDNDIYTEKENINNDNNQNDDNSFDNFSLYRRKKKNIFIGDNKFDKLSDEMILMILKWLSKKCLVPRDEALWIRLDLGSKVLTKGTLGHILPRGVQILRLAQAEFSDPLFLPGCDIMTDYYTSKLQYLDLSMSVISSNGLTSLLSKCRLLKKLSLEKCTLEESTCEEISFNTELSVLNLTMCEGINETCIKHLIKLKSLNSLNMAWCSLDSASIDRLCRSLPQSLTRLNISGCRKTLTDTMVKNLIVSCPKLVELDISDCAMVTLVTTNSILNLKHLEHLSMSRCYSIPPSTFWRLAPMPSLMYLDCFGILKEENLQLLKSNANKTQINKFLYSSVARPTVGVRRTSIWGLRVRD
ncbi:hypothetical protein HCN44_004547 [Aphidius gifuensis]|uniref:Uncharacterized protein n=1 Tax=Aphidius gifuensis TaxID=684658 RepID=A0A835CW47_APHGI|nr:hypothetical protein HCN44_004547 [Aphidius gifuensis]